MNKPAKQIWIDCDAGFVDAVSTLDYSKGENGDRLFKILMDYRDNMKKNVDRLWARSWEALAVQRFSDLIFNPALMTPEIPKEFAELKMTKQAFKKFLETLCGEGVEDIWSRNGNTEATLDIMMYRFAKEWKEGHCGKKGS